MHLLKKVLTNEWHDIHCEIRNLEIAATGLMQQQKAVEQDLAFWYAEIQKAQTPEDKFLAVLKKFKYKKKAICLKHKIEELRDLTALTLHKKNKIAAAFAEYQNYVASKAPGEEYSSPIIQSLF
jgi:hypothetical protein